MTGNFAADKPRVPNMEPNNSGDATIGGAMRLVRDDAYWAAQLSTQPPAASAFAVLRTLGTICCLFHSISQRNRM